MADVSQRAGWYPDPDGAAGERWWNGVSWSDSRRGGEGVSAAPAVASAPPVVYSAENPAPQAPGQITGHYPTPVRSAVSINAALNPMAFYGFVAGIFGIFFNLLLVPGVLAIIFSVRGIIKGNALLAAGQTANLRVIAIIGLGLGVVGTIIGIVEGAFGLWAALASITFSVN